MSSSELPSVSIAICTRNRSALLEKAVVSVADQLREVPGSELIIVDNNSTDGSRVVAGRLAATYEHVRVIDEPTPGLSRARNRALACAFNDLVAFLDDDAYALPGWLLAVSRAFAVNGTIAAVGGPIFGVYDGQRPRWLDDRYNNYHSLQDHGTDFTVPHERGLWGANLAFRKSLLPAAPFDPSLGRVGKSLISGEESAVLSRLRSEGYAAAYAPAAAVRHLVPAQRMTRGWILRRSFAQGRTKARMRPPAGSAWSLAHRAGLDFWGAARAIIGKQTALALLDPCGPALFGQVARGATRLGSAVELTRLTAFSLGRTSEGPARDLRQ